MGGKCALPSALLVSTEVGFFTVTAVYSLPFDDEMKTMIWVSIQRAIHTVRERVHIPTVLLRAMSAHQMLSPLPVNQTEPASVSVAKVSDVMLQCTVRRTIAYMYTIPTCNVDCVLWFIYT